ncbi:MAG: enoyl-CoA hydratase/isomerase family protein [Actinomycetota bacterium]|nr:enoyl-CoA hydratase/isomerase family protein [Actinomycetota bacterium]
MTDARTGSDLVHTELVDGVGIVTFNRPDRHNAMDDEMSDVSKKAMRWALTAPAVRCILLRGNGKSFCSGRDTSVLGHRAGGESDYDFVRRHQQIRLETLESQKVVIAALKGGVIGGGMEMALAADIRIADTTARFALPEVGFALVPDTGATQLLPRLVGPARAKLIIIGGERIDAQTAYEWGLVEKLVAPDELDDTALALATRIAGLSPLAVAQAKQLIDQSHTGSLRDGFSGELHAQVAMFTSADYQESKAARREGRPPHYEGR